MKFIAVGLLALLLAGCAAPAQPFRTSSDPSDPRVRVSAVGYRSTIASYTSQRPAEPTPWREQNERVTPQPKSSQ